jgi:hypothetical protein
MKPPASTLVIALVALALALLGYGFLKSAVSHKSVTVAALAEQIEAQSVSAGRIAAARAALAELAGDEGLVQGYFVSPTGVVALIDALQSLGQALGTEVGIDSVSANASKTALALSLTIKGPFDAVMRTVGAIEYAPYDISVTGLSLSASGKDAWTANLTLLVGSAPGTAASTTTSP